MRYGCCVNLVTQTRNISGTDVVPGLKSIGFDYAELSLSHLCAMSSSKFYEVKSILSDTGLPFEVCNNFFSAGIQLTGPTVDHDKIIRYLDKAFQRSQALGIQTIVFGSGAARMIPIGFPVKKATDQLVDLLRLINRYAIGLGITIAIEPLRQQECNIINTYKEALDLAKLANALQIKCLLDYFHLYKEKESISVIQFNKNSLAHVHFSEPSGRIFPTRENKPQYLTFFSNLKQVGYNQRISIEAYSNHFAADARNALQLLKEIEYELSINTHQ